MIPRELQIVSDILAHGMQTKYAILENGKTTCNFETFMEARGHALHPDFATYFIPPDTILVNDSSAFNNDIRTRVFSFKDIDEKLKKRRKAALEEEKALLEKLKTVSSDDYTELAEIYAKLAKYNFLLP